MSRATERDDPRGIVPTEHASGLGRRDFAETVANHNIRCDAPGLKERGQRGLNRVDERLGETGVVESRRILARFQFTHHRPSQMRHERAIVFEHGFTKDRLALRQPTRHALPLASLSREDEYAPWLPV